jgi:Polyketide cyclase / dehydrase and lipid transport
MTSLLKRALLTNAGFSAVCGGAFAVLSVQVAGFVGVGDPLIYRVIGAGLLLFAACVMWLATRNPINAFYAALISSADLLWVAGTAVFIVLARLHLQVPGGVGLMLVAAAVLLFALLQLKGIARMYAAPERPGHSRLCVAVSTPVSADSMWARIADLGGIRRYSPTLVKVMLRNGARPGLNAVRQCTDQAGKTWAEHCTRFDDAARTVEMRFLADERAFPYPFRTMRGGWAVDAQSSGSTVRIWFEVMPKHVVLHPFLLALMSKDLARSFGDTVARMVIDAQGEVVPPVGVDPAEHGVTYRLKVC